MSIDKSWRVGVLMGGLSSERAVSMKSGNAVLSALRERGWDARAVVVGRDLPHRLVENKIDVAWLALHGRFGEDGCVQGLLEVMGIPYTGCDVRASAVAMDKIATKRAMAGVDQIDQVADTVVRAGDPLPTHLLPCVVKPSVGGSTIGISKASTSAELETAIEAALILHHEVLVESLIVGEEITVAVIDGRALPVVRILPDSGFFDYEAKYQEGRTIYQVPAELPAAPLSRAQRAAEAAYRRLDCRGLCRADFLIDEAGIPWFLEINTIPGMTATSLSPMAAAAEGTSFEVLVERVLLGARCMEEEAAPDAAFQASA
jgi:D-alanine-D-alanine ligase